MVIAVRLLRPSTAQENFPQDDGFVKAGTATIDGQPRKLLAQPWVVGIGVGRHGRKAIECAALNDEYEARIARGRGCEGEAGAEGTAAGGKSELQEAAA